MRVVLAGAAVLFIAASMRSPISSLGAVLPDIRHGLGLSPFLGGLLTAFPPLVFGLVGAAVPRLVRSVPTGRAVTVSAVVIAVGTATRGVGTLPWLIIGTATSMLGIAIVNVLLPVVVHSWFPDHAGWITGAYVAVMQVGTSAGALLTVPVTTVTGTWTVGLALWGVPALVGVLLWTASRNQATVRRGRQAAFNRFECRVLVRDRIAVALLFLFAIQSSVAYVMMGWLPTILRDAGLSPTAAGGMVAVAWTVSIPASFLLPGWLAGRSDQRTFVWWITVPWASGFLGLILAPLPLAPLWAGLIGVGLASFSVSLLLITLRSPAPADTERISAFAQGGGYLLALPAPLLFGMLGDLTGGWTVPLALLLAALWPLTTFGRRAGVGHVLLPEESDPRPL